MHKNKNGWHPFLMELWLVSETPDWSVPPHHLATPHRLEHHTGHWHTHSGQWPVSHIPHTHNMPKACTREPSRARAHRQPQPTLHVWIACNVFLSLRWGYAREMRAGGPLPFFFWLHVSSFFIWVGTSLNVPSLMTKKKVMGRSDKHKPSFWKSSGAECMKRAHREMPTKYADI